MPHLLRPERRGRPGRKGKNHDKRYAKYQGFVAERDAHHDEIKALEKKLSRDISESRRERLMRQLGVLKSQNEKLGFNS